MSDFDPQLDVFDGSVSGVFVDSKRSSGVTQHHINAFFAPRTTNNKKNNENTNQTHKQSDTAQSNPEKLACSSPSSSSSSLLVSPVGPSAPAPSASAAPAAPLTHQQTSSSPLKNDQKQQSQSQTTTSSSSKSSPNKSSSKKSDLVKDRPKPSVKEPAKKKKKTIAEDDDDMKMDEEEDGEADVDNDNDNECVSSSVDKDLSELADVRDEEEFEREEREMAKKLEECIENEEQYPLLKLDTSKWKAGTVPFSALARLFYYAEVESERSRLKIIEAGSELFSAIIRVSPSELIPSVYLCCNRIAPAYEGMEMGIGAAIITKAVATACGKTVAQLREQCKSGDIETVAEASRAKQKLLFGAAPAPLTVGEVYSKLKSLAAIIGSKSQDLKCGIIHKLLVHCQPNSNEARYLVKLLKGALTVNFAEKSVLSALARAVTLAPPKTKLNDHIAPPKKKGNVMQLYDRNKELLGQAYIEVPNYDIVLQALLDYGVEQLPVKCQLSPGVPVRVMLGKPLTSIGELFEKFGDAAITVEWKYDGERAQIHLTPDGKIMIYSRNSENNTGKYPDLIASLPATYAHDNVKSFIIDCEVVAYNNKEHKILPFQALSKRKRKDVKDEDIEVQVCLFGFDLIYLNGKSYLAEPFRVRRATLRETFREVEGKFKYATGTDVTGDTVEEKTAQIQAALDTAIASSCEGLMIKALDVDASYVPNKRNWVKLKKDYMAGVGDTFDLVPIAAYFGEGKRAGVYGSYVLACRNEDDCTFEAITKCGTGFSEELLKQFHQYFADKLIPYSTAKSSYVLPDYPETQVPSVFFDAERSQVWEIKAADLSLSPFYRAASNRTGEGNGIGLRFPRFERIRDDKSPEDATSSEQVVDMFQNQAVQGGNKGAAHDE